jgi:hypothetical protein
MMRRRDFLTTTAAGAAISLGYGKTTAASDPAGPRGLPKTDSDVFSEPELRPAGLSYEATVPDTLDLAERGRLAARGLTNFLDPDRLYEPYQIAFFNSDPPYMSHYGAVAMNWGKITEGILMARHMSGSTENLAEEETMFKGIRRLIRPNGEFAIDFSKAIWAGALKSKNYNVSDTTRVYLSFMVQNQLRPSPVLTELITRMADSVCEKATLKDDYAYVSDVEPAKSNDEIGVLGSWEMMWLHGTSLRGLSRTYALTGDKKYLDMGARFKNLLLRPEYWQPEAAPKAVTGSEHGQFAGHHHSYTAALMGLIWYAGITNDVRVMQVVRESYEYLRTFGIARIGMFGEMCTTGDMAFLAIKLSDLGVSDYWEDVDQYVRNQLVELQMTDAEKLHRAVASMPKSSEMMYPEYAKLGATTDHVIERNVGAYLSDASNPTLVRPRTLRWTICCSGNCPPSLYAAWEAIVRYDAGIARINLLMNRASPWLDMDSHLPYEGKVVIRNKSAEKLFVRIPRWVNQDKVRLEVNGKSGSRAWLGRYLFVEHLRAGDHVRIDFPMTETKETYTSKWKAEDMWPESTNPGSDWKPHDPPDRFTFHFKGNTVVEVTPRAEGPGYPLYVRPQYQAATAPDAQVMRYVSPVVVKV